MEDYITRRNPSQANEVGSWPMTQFEILLSYMCVPFFKSRSGGLSNFLYYVSLPNRNEAAAAAPETDSSNSSKRTRKESYHMEPTKVLLRIYGQSHGEHALETMLTESVVFALLSERQLGPKLHGIFPGGRIEQYIPVSTFTYVHLTCLAEINLCFSAFAGSFTDNCRVS
jgi:hypothetical protein